MCFIMTALYYHLCAFCNAFCPQYFALLWMQLCHNLEGDCREESAICQSVSSVAQSFPALCSPMDCSMPGLPVHHQLLEFTQTHVHWVSDAIQPSHPLLSPSPPAFNLSQHQGLFQWVSSLHQVANYKSFSFNISPSNEHLGLISFRMNCLDLLAVEGSLKSLLQHRSSKASYSMWSFGISISHLMSCFRGSSMW